MIVSALLAALCLLGFLVAVPAWLAMVAARSAIARPSRGRGAWLAAQLLTWPALTYVAALVRPGHRFARPVALAGFALAAAGALLLDDLARGQFRSSGQAWVAESGSYRDRLPEAERGEFESLARTLAEELISAPRFAWASAQTRSMLARWLLVQPPERVSAAELRAWLACARERDRLGLTGLATLQAAVLGAATGLAPAGVDPRALCGIPGA